jgi:orotidine-5'-phosphate decarboxylase
MPEHSAVEKYNTRVEAVGSLLCVGLDSAYDQLPQRFHKEELPQFAFNRWLIEQTHPFVSGYKPNIAFYESRGSDGIAELKLTIDYLRERHPDILTICDAKRADITSTSEHYAQAIFDWLGFDAITLHPYLGSDALQPFLRRSDRASIILCRTSNPGAGELQDIPVNGKPLWQIIAEKVCDEWNANGNCMLVVGATAPQELRQARALVGDMTLLVPGVGAQGGSVEQVVQNGLNREHKGLIINAARSVIFSDNPGKEARRLRDHIHAAIAQQKNG